jgi:hypothetical protein
MARKPKWTKESIKEGFDRFIVHTHRLPKATEIDSVPYLPSSRYIQIRFGGLEQLRQELGYTDTHFGKGVHRSVIAKTVNLRGRTSEIELERYLREKFGEVFVHTERVYGDGKLRVDFYVYTPEGNFAIDVFYPNTMKTLQSNVNIKQIKYKEFKEPLYLVVANKDLTQEVLDGFTSIKKLQLPQNISLVTISKLRVQIESMRIYSNPLLRQ